VSIFDCIAQHRDPAGLWTGIPARPDRDATFRNDRELRQAQPLLNNTQAGDLFCLFE
jgi:hypothetical protein